MSAPPLAPPLARRRPPPAPGLTRTRAPARSYSEHVSGSMVLVTTDDADGRPACLAVGILGGDRVYWSSNEYPAEPLLAPVYFVTHAFCAADRLVLVYAAFGVTLDAAADPAARDDRLPPELDLLVPDVHYCIEAPVFDAAGDALRHGLAAHGLRTVLAMMAGPLPRFTLKRKRASAGPDAPATCVAPPLGSVEHGRVAAVAAVLHYLADRAGPHDALVPTLMHRTNMRRNLSTVLANVSKWIARVVC